MNTIQMRRTLLSFILGGLVALASFSIALAEQPVLLGPFHEEGTVVVADCSAFQVLDDFELNYTVRLFFDNEGTLSSIIFEIWGSDTFINSETGTAYSGNFRQSELVTVGQYGAHSGVIARLTVPGAGAVFLDVGRIVRDREGNILFEAGQHQLADGDFAGLCAALA
jgi:hypothetical protein